MAELNEGELKHLRDRLREFVGDRDWAQFHTPKNLAIALSVEAAEVLEHFQWTSDGESFAIDAGKRERIGDELADVLLCAIRLCDLMDVDLFRAAADKIAANAARYPVDKSRGKALKYTELK